MNSLTKILLMAGAPDAAAAGGQVGNPLVSFVPFILIIAIFYFLIIRPQNKKQKETQKMLDSLKKGDKVVTIGGIHGTITSVRDKSVVLRVDENVKMEFSRSAISSVEAQSKDSEEKESDEKGAKESKDLKKVEDKVEEKPGPEAKKDAE